MATNYPDKDMDERPTIDLRFGDPAEHFRFARHAAPPVPNFAGELRVRHRPDSIDRLEEMQAFNDPGAKAVLDLGRDVHGRCHTIEVRIARLGDGTLGARVTSSLGGLRVQMDTSNSFTMTTHRPDKMPPPVIADEHGDID